MLNLKKLLLLSIFTILFILPLQRLTLQANENMSETDAPTSITNAIEYDFNQLVHVEGVVTVITENRIYLQDPDGTGLYIHLTIDNSAQFDSVEVGNKISVFGPLDAFTSVSNYSRLLRDDVVLTSNDLQNHSIYVNRHTELEWIVMSHKPYYEFTSLPQSPVASRVYEIYDVEFDPVNQFGERQITGTYFNHDIDHDLYMFYKPDNTDIPGLSENSYVDGQIIESITFVVEGLSFGNLLMYPISAELKDFSFTLHEDRHMTIEQGDPYVEPGATATDLDGNDLTIVISGEVDTDIPGEYIITYEVLDLNDEIIHTTERTVYVDGEHYPEITLIGEEVITVAYGEEFVDPGATAENSLGETYTVTTHGSVNTMEAGHYTLEYTVTADDGTLIGPVTRTVIVENPNAPVFDAPNIIIKNADYIAPSDFYSRYINATDFEDNDITNQIEIIKNDYTGNANITGRYEITFRVADNQDTASRHTVDIVVQRNLLPLLIIDNTHFVLSHVYHLTDEDFIDSLKKIDLLQNETFVFSDIYDNYSANYNVEGTYAKEFSLLSESGTDHLFDLLVTVIDDDADFIQPEIGFIDATIEFIKTWWIALGVLALIVIGLKAR